MKKIFIILALFVFSFTKAYSQHLQQHQQHLQQTHRNNDLENVVRGALIIGAINGIINSQQQIQPQSQTVYVDAYNVGGALHFTDGTYRTFRSVVGVHHSPMKDAYNMDYRNDGLYVLYGGTYLTLPFENISTIRVIPESIYSTYFSGYLEIVTKNGATFTTPATDSDILVSIFDNYSGNSLIQSYRFVNYSTLLISWIEIR